MFSTALLCTALLLQTIPQLTDDPFDDPFMEIADIADHPSEHEAVSFMPDSPGAERENPAVLPEAPHTAQTPEAPASSSFQWRNAMADSAKFLFMQTGARIAFQQKTRRDLAGPFFRDFAQTLKAPPRGFMDGDSWVTNFVGHPIQGATSYHIARLNGASRSQAFWWGVGYSTHFELGLLGEAGIGNVRLSPVDLLVTPTAGFLAGTTEEWIWNRLGTSERKLFQIVKFFVIGRQLSRMASGR